MARKTRKPVWSRTNPVGFVRGFGQIEDRYNGLRSGPQRKLYMADKAERFYVNATRYIFPVPRFFNFNSDDYKVNHVFSRLVSDGYFTVRIEIGFNVTFSHKEKKDFLLDEIIDEILRTPLYFKNRKPGLSKSYRTQEVASVSKTVERLRDRFFEKTTLRSQSGNVRVTDFMDFLGLSVFVDCGRQEIDQRYMASNLIAERDGVGFDIVFVEKVISGLPASIWVTGDCREGWQDRMRRIRLHILRLSPEIRSLEAAVSHLNEFILRGSVSSDMRGALLGRMLSSIDRLSETGQSLLGDMGALKFGMMVSSEAMSDIVNSIKVAFSEVVPEHGQWFAQRMNVFGKDFDLPVLRNMNYKSDANGTTIIMANNISNTTKNIYSAQNVGVQGYQNELRDVNMDVVQNCDD